MSKPIDRIISDRKIIQNARFVCSPINVHIEAHHWLFTCKEEHDIDYFEGRSL